MMPRLGVFSHACNWTGSKRYVLINVGLYFKARVIKARTARKRGQSKKRRKEKFSGSEYYLGLRTENLNEIPQQKKQMSGQNTWLHFGSSALNHPSGKAVCGPMKSVHFQVDYFEHEWGKCIVYIANTVVEDKMIDLWKLHRAGKSSLRVFQIAV